MWQILFQSEYNIGKCREYNFYKFYILVKRKIFKFIVKKIDSICATL